MWKKTEMRAATLSNTECVILIINSASYCGQMNGLQNKDKRLEKGFAYGCDHYGAVNNHFPVFTIVPPFIPLTITPETTTTKVHTLVLGWCSGAWRYREGLHLQAGVLSSSNLAPHFERNLLEIFPQVGIYSWAGAPWDTFRWEGAINENLNFDEDDADVDFDKDNAGVNFD